MSSISEERVLETNNEILKSEMDGEVIMLSVEKGVYYNLNSTGSFIYNLLEDKPLSIEEILDEVYKTFKRQNDDVKSETLTFLEDMIEKEILLVKG